MATIAPAGAAGSAPPQLAPPPQPPGTGRVGGKLSISTAVDPASSSHPTLPISPRTPRRESRDATRNGSGTAAGRRNGGVNAKAAAAAAAAAANPASGAAGGTTGNGEDAHGKAAGSTATNAAVVANGDAGAVDKARKPSKWSVIRKGVVPNPALMKVNEKVLQIIQTLRKAPEDRAEGDIKLLYTWLMNQEKLSSLFTTMSEVSAKKLCKEMEFLHLASGDVVVNQGDKGNTCFILVSGLVSVYVRGAEDQKKYQRMARAALDGAGARRLHEQGLVTYGTKVATLTPGATFGELCLIEPDSKRSATVVVDPAAQIANFIVLSAASYLRMTRSQTIEGTITDHIAFLQHMLLFHKWSKMQLMHLVNSMKLVSVPAGQYLAHKGAEAESFFVVLRGEAQECVKLLLNEHSDLSSGESRGVQHCVTVELTYLGKFDVAGEYLAAEKKVVTCPVDIRAVSDVDCLVLSRKLFNLHFGGKELKKHAARALRQLRHIAEQRETWRETRVKQALQYPTLRVPITRKLMRLSGNACMICGRATHLAGDELCMELATYRMDDEKKKKQGKQQHTRAHSRHRISVAIAPTQASALAAEASKRERTSRLLPALHEDEEDDDDEDDDDRSEQDGEERRSDASRRLGHRLVSRQWKAAEKAGLSRRPTSSSTGRTHTLLPQRPASTPQSVAGGGGRRAGEGGVSGASDSAGTVAPHLRGLRITSITHAQHVSRRKLLHAQGHGQGYGAGSGSGSGSGQSTFRAGNGGSLDDEIRRIRESWPYHWKELDAYDHNDDARELPRYELLYRNSPRAKSPRAMTASASSSSGRRSAR